MNRMTEIAAKDEKAISFFSLVSFFSSLVHCQPGPGSRSLWEPTYLIRGISFSSKDEDRPSRTKRSLVNEKEISFSRSYDDAKEISLKDEKDLHLLFEVL